MAGERCNLRLVHLQGGDPRDQRFSQCAANRGNGDLLDRNSPRKRVDRHTTCPTTALGRRGRDRGSARLSLRRNSPCSARRRRVSLPRGVRTMGKRHDDAGLYRHRGSTRRDRRDTVWHPRLSCSPRAAGLRADPRSHADGTDLRLSHSDPVSVRLRSRVGADRDGDLCDASHGPRHHDRAQCRAERDRGIRHDGRHDTQADAAQGHASRSPAAASGRRQSGHHALA